MSFSNPERILKLSRDFMECRILLTGAQLNIFTILGRKKQTAAELAVQKGLALRGLVPLLDALAAMGLLEKDGGGYWCSRDIARYLSEDSPQSVLPMVLHCVSLWDRWSCLTEIVKGAPCEPDRPLAKPDELRAFIGAMHVVAAPLAARIIESVGPGGAKMLLDVGGASGTYTMAFLERSPAMKATLFDRPAVIEMARALLGSAGLADRVNLVAGDFYRDEFPTGHDLAFVSAIIHQNSPGQNLELYRKTYRALVEGGRIVIRDHVMGPDRTQPRNGAVFAINMLVGTEGGGTYTFEEIADGLSAAGFRDVKQIKTGEHMDSLIEAFK
jgi:predicted O-methyltransferase YrrM